MEVLIAFAICMAFVAMGDVLSLVTKAKIPALAGAIILYLIFIWCGMPQQFPEVSGMAALGDVLFPVFVAALATSVLPMTMVKEWRFMIIGFMGVIGGFLFTVVVGGIFFDYREMFAGAMTTCGAGFTGGVLVLDRLKELGMTEMLTVPLLLATTIDAIGQPVGSFLMQKYVKGLIHSDAYLNEKTVVAANYASVKLNRYNQPYDSPENPSPWFTSWIPPKYETEAVALFQIIVVVAISYFLGNLTGLGWSFIVVIIGLLGNFLGYYRMDMMERTKSSGIIMAAIFIMVFQMLNDLTLSAILEKIVPILAIVILSGAGLIVGGMLGAKLFGYDPWLGAASTIGLFYLFPGVKNIINEVARSLSRNEEERAFIISKVSAPAIITASMGGKLCLLCGTLLIPILIK